MENVWRVVDQNKWTFTSCIPNSESDSLWLNLVALSDAPRQHAHLVRSLHAALRTLLSSTFERLRMRFL